MELIFFKNMLFHPGQIVGKSKNIYPSKVLGRISEKEKIPIKLVEKTIVCKRPNNFFLLSSEKLVAEVVSLEENGLYKAKVYRHARPVFTEPCNSKILGILQLRSDSHYYASVNKNELVKKAICFPLNEVLYILQILHN